MNQANDLHIIEQNELALLKKDLIEIQETFQMVGELVEEQGEPLDNIENSVEMSNMLTQDSNIELKDAKKNQGKKMKKKSILVGAGLVAVNIPLAALVGLQVSLPVTIIGTGAYFGSKLIKKKKTKYTDPE